MHRCCFGDLQIWASTQSYADAYYVLRKHAPAEEVKHALLATLDIFMVCGTYAADLRGALESDWSDIEDLFDRTRFKAYSCKVSE